jgi:acyl-CoA thioester hydrolase
MPDDPVRPFETTLEVAFRDLDAMGHVNNAVYFTYLETARTRFFVRELDLASPGDLPVILAEACCTFRAAATFGECLTVSLSVGRISARSFDLHHQITGSGGRLVADARTVMVAYDYQAGRPIAIPDRLRAVLERYYLPVAPE